MKRRNHIKNRSSLFEIIYVQITVKILRSTSPRHDEKRGIKVFVNSRASRFTAHGKKSGTLWTEDWAGPVVSLDLVEKRNISCSDRNSSLGLSTM